MKTEKKIKAKPKQFKCRRSKFKTASSAKIHSNAVDRLKRRYMQSKAEIKRRMDEQTERPENYAVDEVEDKTEGAIYAVCDSVVHTKNKVYNNLKKHMSKRDISKDADKRRTNKAGGSSKLKTRSEYEKSKNSEKLRQTKLNLKNGDSAVHDGKGRSVSVSVTKIKAKDEYMKANDVPKVRTKKNDIVHRSESVCKNKINVNAKRVQNSESKKRAFNKCVQEKQNFKEKTGKEIMRTDFELTKASVNNASENRYPMAQAHNKQSGQSIKTKDNYIKNHTNNNNVGIRTYRGIRRNSPLYRCGAERTPKSYPKTHESYTAAAPSEAVPNHRVKTIAPKTAKHGGKQTEHHAVKAQKRSVKQAAKQAAKAAKELAQRSAQAAKAASKTAVKIAVKAAQLTAAAAKAAVSALASLGGWAVLLVVLIIVIIIAAIAASPFGIFISDEVSDTGAIPLSQIIAEYNVELTQEVEDIELSVDHAEVEVVDNQTDANIVIAVFAARTAGTDDNTAEDVVIFDSAKAEKLKEYFRSANTVEYETEETVISEDETSVKLIITITGKTKDELMDLYGLSAKQREAVETLLEHGDILTMSSHSLTVTDADVKSIISSLPDSLPQKRKDVVNNAGSLVGKVNYFWGGKSSAIGWDSRWGSMQKVTADGSPSSGTIRAYGLDCSGFVSWVFHNSGFDENSIGHGTSGQKANSVFISESEVQAGDLAFLPSYSHVGIVVGQDADGNILVIHCSSGSNNVVVSTAGSIGFTVFRRPYCY